LITTGVGPDIHWANWSKTLSHRLVINESSRRMKLKNTDVLLIPRSRRDMRSLALQLLYAIDRLDYTVELEEVVENFKTGFNVDIAPDSLAIEMSKGTIALREKIETQLRPLLHHWKLERLGCCTRLVLNLALWELQQPDAIPSIVINEAIELAKGFAEKDSYKFINGILDEAAKKLFADEKGEPCEPNKTNRTPKEPKE